MTTIIRPGRPFRPSDINDWAPVSAVKAALTGRNTTTTISADPDLSIALLAGATYRFTADLLLSSAVNASGDWRGAMAWTGTATVTYGCIGLTTAIASGASADVLTSPTTRLDTTSPGSEYLTGCSVSGMLVQFIGRIVCTTAVTLTLHWAQRVSNANDTRVLEGSLLTAFRIA